MIKPSRQALDDVREGGPRIVEADAKTGSANKEE
jgi:hypothetical protein